MRRPEYGLFGISSTLFQLPGRLVPETFSIPACQTSCHPPQVMALHAGFTWYRGYRIPK